MADLTRRDKTVPVQARRVDGGPVAVPAAAVQNVVYVEVPAAPPPVVTEVHHHHHHTTEVATPPRPRRRPHKGTSFLATLGLVVGGLACGTALLPQVARFAGPIALGGLGMAAVAWVGAVLLRRVGAMLPFAAVVVSAAGYGLFLYQTGQGQSTWDGLRRRSPVPLPAVRIDPPTPPAAPAPAAGTPPPIAAPTVVPAKPEPIVVPPPAKRDSTIFDLDSPGWTKPTPTH